jgi:hypothetical protein
MAIEMAIQWRCTFFEDGLAPRLFQFYFIEIWKAGQSRIIGIV